MILRRLVGRLGRLLSRWAGAEEADELVLDARPTEVRVRLLLDRMRVLRWTNLEAMRFKRRTDIDLWRDEIQPLEWSIDHFMEFLAVAALVDDPGVTAEALAPYVAGEKVTEAMAAVMVLIGDWVPDMEEGATENPRVASALTRLMVGSVGRSPSTPSASPTKSTGASARGSSPRSTASG